jgi:hypothetical protein
MRTPDKGDRTRKTRVRFTLQPGHSRNPMVKREKLAFLKPVSLAKTENFDGCAGVTTVRMSPAKLIGSMQCLGL